MYLVVFGSMYMYVCMYVGTMNVCICVCMDVVRKNVCTMNVCIHS